MSGPCEGWHTTLRVYADTNLDEPRPLPETVETKLVRDLSGVHGVGEILLVGENEEEGVAELILVEHALELLTSLGDTFPIVGVNDEDDTLRVLEVCERAGREAGAHGRRAESESGGHVRRRGRRDTHNASREDGSYPVLRRPRR